MPVPENSKPINRFSMREEVYNTLLDWIMEGILRPGEKVLDKDLAERLGVSRTPVREAIRRLEDKGLIESAANKWTRVARVSIEEPKKFYPIIWTLEELALEQGMEKLCEKDFELMDRLNTKIAKAVNDGDAIKASLTDTEFHNVYIEKSGNQHLIDILQDLKIKFRRVEVTYFGGSACAMVSVEEHAAILEALRNKDSEGAKSIVRQNWVNSLARLQEIEQELLEENLPADA